MITKLEHAFTGDTSHNWMSITSYDDSDCRKYSTELKLGLA